MQQKENQFEDAVLNWNLGDREVSALQYLGGYAFKKILQKIITFTKNFEIEKKNTKLMSFNNAWLYFLHGD